MRISTDFTYPAEIEKVHAMLCDPQYRQIRAGADHELKAELKHDVSPSESRVIETVVPLPEKLSGPPVGKLLGGHKTIALEEAITPIENGSFTCAIKPITAGIPAQGKINLTLTEHGQLTKVKVSGEIKVHVMFIGATIEAAIAKRIPQAVEHEIACAQQYLQTHK